MQVNELAFTRDGKLFMQATSSGVEVQCHPLSLRHLQASQSHAEALGQCNTSFHWSVSIALKGLLLQVYSTATYEKYSMLNGHTGTVHSISISPDDR